MAEIPRAAASLAKKLDLDAGWTYRFIPGRGLAERGSLSDERNEKGSRHRVQEMVEVNSLSIRARHADGRFLVAVWIRWADETRWTMNLAMRGPDLASGEMMPIELAAREAVAYAVGAPRE